MMRVLVAYASVFGATRAIAEEIGEILGRGGSEVRVAPVGASPDPATFDAVILGSSVHRGHWVDEGAAFLKEHEEALATRPVWLFSSGPVGDRAVRSRQPDPPEVAVAWSRIRPQGHHVFAGAFDRSSADFRQRSLVERTIVKRVLPDGDWRDWDAIDTWARDISATLAAAPARR